MAFNKYSQSYHALAIYSSSFEVTSRTSHEIIPFDDIISIKIQYQIEIPGFFAFHPVDIFSSIFNKLTGKESSVFTQLYYEIVTDAYSIQNYFIDVPQEIITTFINLIYQESGLKPHTQEYQTVEYYGSLFYFSFRDLHTELDPDSVRELL